MYQASLTSVIPEERWEDLLTEDELASVRAGDTEPPQESTTWGIPVTVPTSESEPAATAAAASAAAAAPSKTTFRYRTFIADAYVAGPQIACTPPTGTYRFKGDNRSWSSSSGTSRTQVTTQFMWTTATMSTVKSVGSTTRQVKNSNNVWVHDDTKNAGTSGITTTNKSMSSTSARLYMKIAVGNPFCNPALTLPIYAELQIEVKRSGSYSILAGTRRPVPNHEAYLRRDSSSTWTRILQRKNDGFGCLAAINFCAYDSLVKTGSY
ncbi:hypothetical protein AVP41_02821 [Microbacterium sp. TNHR37B]|nr:hypothetical protein AVP41_02821 [Microbacterium sp. TNHR37B]